MASLDWINDINLKIAKFITRCVGTMWSTYFFILISLIVFPYGELVNHIQTNNMLLWLCQHLIPWFTAYFIQFTMLSIIQTSQNNIDHEDSMREERQNQLLEETRKLILCEIKNINLIADNMKCIHCDGQPYLRGSDDTKD